MSVVLLQLYPISAQILFSLLCSALSMQFKSICHEIDQVSAHNFGIGNLKLRHLAVCDSVDQLNRCFGPLLVFNVSSAILGATNLAFYVFESFSSVEKMAGVICFFYLVDIVINLLILAHAADRMKIQVTDLVKY